MINKSARTPGILYIVATPIGNLEDISTRAIKVLNMVDTILAEDTRHSKQLLSNLGIKKPLSSFHAHNELEKSAQIIDRLLSGESFALISDAGTPLISDPGYPLIKKAREEHISVIPIPGPSAVITALSAAGVPSDIFTFAGFLPAKKTARQEKLKYFLKLEHTLVFYESTHRILNTLEDITEVFGAQTQVVLVKELTKIYERFINSTCTKIKDWLLQDPNNQKGEFVIIIPPRLQPELTQENEVLCLLLQELPLKKAVQLAATITGCPKNELYKKALQLKPDQ